MYIYLFFQNNLFLYNIVSIFINSKRVFSVFSGQMVYPGSSYPHELKGFLCNRKYNSFHRRVHNHGYVSQAYLSVPEKYSYCIEGSCLIKMFLSSV